jgi:hypothetical protein
MLLEESHDMEDNVDKGPKRTGRHWNEKLLSEFAETSALTAAATFAGGCCFC